MDENWIGQAQQSWVPPEEWIQVSELEYNAHPLKLSPALSRRYLSVQKVRIQLTSKHDSSFRCSIALGVGEWRSTLQSRLHRTPEEAFEDVCGQLKECPDEPLLSWKSEINRRLINNSVSVRSAVMRNVVPVGIPRYMCVATWNDENHSKTSSTTWATMGQALLETISRCNEKIAKRPSAEIKPQLDRAAKALLLSGAVTYNTLPGSRFKAKIKWRELDGSSNEVVGSPEPSMKLAYDSALVEAKKLQDRHHMDWSKAAVLMLQARPHAVKVQHRRTELGSIVCSIMWGPSFKTRIEGKPASSERLAFVSACELANNREIRTKQGQQIENGATQKRMEIALIRLRSMRPKLEAERSTLISRSDRDASQNSRLKDITTLLAVLDPALRRGIDFNRANLLLEQFVLDADHAPTLPGYTLTATQQGKLIGALKISSIDAGANVEVGSEFARAANDLGLKQGAALEELIARRLLRLASDGTHILTMAGHAALLSYGASSVSPLASALDKLQRH